MIDKIHEVEFSYDGIILNRAAYSRFSVAIADGISFVKMPVVKVHKSNIYART